MNRPVVIDCLRTPVGRAHPERGVFRNVRSDDLAVAVIEALVKRTGIDVTEIEDVVLGNTQQQGEQGFQRRSFSPGLAWPACRWKPLERRSIGFAVRACRR